MADDEDQIRSHSDSPDPSSSSPPPPGKFTVTVASPAPPEKDPDASPLALLPIKSSGGGGREDCWSEKATGVLIDAWGKIHMELSRGNLKQKHWEEVAETVRRKEEDNGKTPKTDVQCKNRMDTVKKKYKQEKLTRGRSSSWVFFDKLDRLIGSTAKISSPPPPRGLLKIPMGKIHMELSRGNLKQKHWEKVAETVRRKEEDNGKTPKTDVQCKNRIDTVKKKYKQEKLRSGRSSWVFFDKLDRLIGSTAKISPAPPPSGLGGGLHNIPMGIPMGRGLNLYHQQGKAETPRFGGNAKRLPLTRKRNVSDSHSEDSGGDSLPPPPPLPQSKRGNKWREVSSAIMRFGEAYEQIENAKLQQVVEMEKERLRFLKELESQRMHFFVKFQFELSQQREENGKH
ncbi:unnamed protein product [Brassica rapa subsp. trilocularis]